MKLSVKEKIASIALPLMIVFAMVAWGAGRQEFQQPCYFLSSVYLNDNTNLSLEARLLASLDYGGTNMTGTVHLAVSSFTWDGTTLTVVATGAGASNLQSTLDAGNVATNNQMSLTYLSGGTTLYARAAAGCAVYGTGATYAIKGLAAGDYGLYGAAANYGAYGDAATDYGVYGQAANDYGVYGEALGDDYGVYGQAANDYGVYGEALGDDYGVYGVAADDYGVYGYAGDDKGVYGEAVGSYGGYFTSGGDVALHGYAGGSYGVEAQAVGSYGGWFQAGGNYGVYGQAETNYGVYGYALGSYGGYFLADGNIGLYAKCSVPGGTNFQTWTGGVNEVGGPLFVSDYVRQQERSSDPADPSEGRWVFWLSDGTGYGDDGDVCFKVNAGGAVYTNKLAGFNVPFLTTEALWIAASNSVVYTNTLTYTDAVAKASAAAPSSMVLTQGWSQAQMPSLYYAMITNPPSIVTNGQNNVTFGTNTVFGTNVYVAEKLGVGVNSPLFPVDVAGIGRFHGIYVGGDMNWASAAQYGFLQWDGAANQYFLRFNMTASGIGPVTYFPTGKVGINTNAPREKFDVVGNVICATQYLYYASATNCAGTWMDANNQYVFKINMGVYTAITNAIP